MRTTYEVNALALSADCKPTRLFTQSVKLTLKECDNQVEIWKKEYGYRLLVSWVDARYANGSTRVVHFQEHDWRIE